jgi:hypothetical protein
MTPTTARAEYEARRARAEAAVQLGERHHLVVSNLRLAALLLAAVFAWLGLLRGAVAPSWALLPVGAFLVLLVVHARVLNARDRKARARDYYARGLSRLDGTWSGSGPDGSRFLEGHPYANDLDLFGPGSLFERVSTAKTDAGEATLAAWLGRASTVDEIRSRQEAVAELRSRVDFREAMAVVAAETPVLGAGALAAWAAAEPVGLGITHAWIFGACAAATTVAGGLLLSGAMPAGLFVAWVATQAGIAAAWRDKVRRVVRGVDRAERDLSLLTELLVLLERETFTSARLRALHARLTPGGVPLSRRVARLRTFIAARDALRNEFVRPFALLLLVRSQAAVAIDRWHAANRAGLAGWIAATGEFEALASLATYAFERAGDPFPELIATGARFEATAIGHPLMSDAVGVPNDVSIGGDAPHVLIVSGSNMSGKSTLLRTVGVNLALAMAGAPVRATALRCSPCVIGATIHVQDSLQAGQSRFYAEILRIQHIVDLTRGSAPVLFLLDEILHGTNSHDRRIGAQAIATTLVEAGAIGLVTTHDLALTELVQSLGPRARNVHFEDRLEGGRMVFDYRMRDGIVTHSNAIALMRAVGLRV